MLEHRPETLRDTLVETGLELLRDGGQSALTLRKCAAGAGVSHAAPAHHFKDLNGLLTAIAAQGFRIFKATMVAACERAPADPRSALLAICRGYLTFAVENEALFALMFSSDKISFKDSDLGEASTSAYQVLADSCAPFQTGPGGRKGLEIMVWSLLHGFAGISRNARASGGKHPAGGIEFEQILPRLELADPTDAD